MLRCKHSLCVFLLLFLLIDVSGSEEQVKIGIIGAGVGGTSTAFFLRELFGENAHIDIFEKDQVGGRLAPIIISGSAYNAGGTILHPENLYMKNFTDILGLARDTGSEEGTLGIFNGEEMLLQTSDWSMVTKAKMFWRYGMDAYNLGSWIDEQIKYMHRLYKIQEEGHAFSTVEDLISAMNPKFLDWTKKSTRTVLKDEGFSDLFIDEFVTAVTRANYGQMSTIHGLVGAASLAGAQSGLWNVDGGNHEVPKGLLKKSGANLIKADVRVISLIDEDPPLYQVDYLPSGAKMTSEDDLKSKEYDIVVIASPVYKGQTNIKFEDFQKEIMPVDNEFHLTVATFVEGMPNTSSFGVTDAASFPTQIFTTKDNGLINSFLTMKPIDRSTPDKQVQRLFSNKVPSESELKAYIPEYTDLRMVNWNAYPEYSSSVTLPSFTLHSQLYHVNAIEMAFSSMEMSAVGAKNVALLAYYRWKGDYDKIDEDVSASIVGDGKSEL